MKKVLETPETCARGYDLLCVPAVLLQMFFLREILSKSKKI